MPSERPHEIKKQTEFITMHQELVSLNDRLFKTVNGIESVGHRLKDTNCPSAPTGECYKDGPTGFIQDMFSQLQSFRQSVNRLEEALAKFDEII